MFARTKIILTPQLTSTTQGEALGLLGKFASTPAFFEPFRNRASADEIGDCVLKLLLFRGQLQREAKRARTRRVGFSHPQHQKQCYQNLVRLKIPIGYPEST